MSREDQWIEQYGTRHGLELMVDDMKRSKAVSDRRTLMWQQIKRHLKISGHRYPDWPVCIDAARKLGYHDYANAWEKGIVNR